MGFIKWDVKEVRLDKELGRGCGLTAILKGSAPWGVDTDDVVGIHKNLYNRLNLTVDSLYPHMLTPQEFYNFILNTEFAVDKDDRILSVVRPGIKNVVFNAPATIVFWKDGSKTVVKAQNNELFDPEKGLAMAIAKKTMGNKGNYYNEIKKWVDEFYEGKTFGDALMKAAETKKKDTDHSKYASLKAAFYSLGQVSTDKRTKKSDMVDAMEEAMKYIKEFLDKEDQ